MKANAWSPKANANIGPSRNTIKLHLSKDILNR